MATPEQTQENIDEPLGAENCKEEEQPFHGDQVTSDGIADNINQSEITCARHPERRGAPWISKRQAPAQSEQTERTAPSEREGSKRGFIFLSRTAPVQMARVLEPCRIEGRIHFRAPTLQRGILLLLHLV